MSDNDVQLLRDKKDEIIAQILREEDLYKILGASPESSAKELRRSYLERSKLCHPDKPPYHANSTSAFQRLGFAFEILKSPSTRLTYDRATTPSTRQLPEKTNFLGGDHTFRNAVSAILNEFLTGDFATVRGWLENAHARWPNMVSAELVYNVENAFVRIRELVITSHTFGLLVYIELGRIHRVQKRLMALGYLDVLGRAKLTFHLVRVTLAVPMRVDRALKMREERAWRARAAGLHANNAMEGGAAQEAVDVKLRAGILNERVSAVLGFIVGNACLDETADEAWSSRCSSERS